MGRSSRSKRCFTKMWGFPDHVHPPFFLLLKMSEKSSTGYWTAWERWDGNGREICKHFFTWLNADSCLFPLLFCLLEVLSSNMAPPRWGNRDRACVCVCVCLITDLPLWNKTGSCAPQDPSSDRGWSRWQWDRSLWTLCCFVLGALLWTLTGQTLVMGLCS